MERIADMFLRLLGWMLGRTPPVLVAFGCSLLGAAIWRFSDRRRTILSGLERSFPDRDEAWRQRVGRRHASRVFEMFLLIAGLPYWPERRRKAWLQVDPALRELLAGPGRDRPVVFFMVHSALTEGMSVLPSFVPEMAPSTIIYRPLDFGPAERYVKRAREHWGMELVSRREGLLQAKQRLRHAPGIAGVLFDQSAGGQGHLMLFFNRLCSTTPLPAMLATRAGALPLLVRMRREGFWRGTIMGEVLPEKPGVAELMTEAHAALERVLREDDEACAGWFWAHKRWKGTLRPHQFLSLEQRKSFLPEQMAALGLEELPRRTRVVVRLAPDPALLPATNEFLDLLRKKRPDAEFDLLVPAGLPETALPSVERVTTLPLERQPRRDVLRRVEERYPDVLLCLDPSPEASREASLFGCELKAGVILTAGRKRAYMRAVAEDPAAYREDPRPAWRRLLVELGMAPDAAAAAFSAADPAPSAHPEVSR